MKQYSKKDLKDFDVYLTNLLVNALKDFRSKYKFIPASIYNDCDSEEAAIKKWDSILDMMINDFSFYGKDIDIETLPNDVAVNDYMQLTKDKHEKLKEGFALLAEYLPSLWV